MSKANALNRIKYRPSFTAAQVREIVRLCREAGTEEASSVRKILVPFLAKIDEDCIAPSYVMSAAPRIAFGSNEAIDCGDANNVGADVSISAHDKAIIAAMQHRGKEAFAKLRADELAMPTSEDEPLSSVLTTALIYGMEQGWLNDTEMQLVNDYGLA